MAKFLQILFVAFLAVALCSAEAPRSRSARFQNRRRFLARQEVEAEPDAVTPYPSADELKPEVPFDEAVAAEEQQPNTPDEVYGPPEGDAPVETDDAAATEKEQAIADEEEAAVAEEEAAAAEEAAVAEEEEEEAAALSRYTARRSSSVRISSARPAKLRKAAPARLQIQPQIAPQPIFYYIAQ